MMSGTNSEYESFETPPLGAHAYLGLVYSITGKSANQLNLLDLGCGPGEYVKYFFQQGLNSATIVDSSDKVLNTAKTRLENYLEKVTILNAQLPDLDILEDCHYDVVTINNVLHHLHNPDTQDYTKITLTLREIYRVLKPGGVLIIAESTPLQDIVHWIPVYPKYAAEIMVRVLPSKVITSLLKGVNFIRIQRAVFPDDEIDPKFIYTGEGEKDVAGEIPDYKSLVNMIACEEERERLNHYENCYSEMKNVVGMYTLYYAQKECVK